MQTLLRSLIALSLFGGAALYLCPEGGSKRVLKLLVTALLVAALLEPLRAPDFDLLSAEEARLASLETKLLQDSERKQNTLKELLLRQNCERFIITQAQGLGLRVERVEVELADAGAKGLQPGSVTLEASGGAEELETLSRLIRDELGIPVERQVWITDES